MPQASPTRTVLSLPKSCCVRGASLQFDLAGKLLAHLSNPAILQDKRQSGARLPLHIADPTHDSPLPPCHIPPGEVNIHTTQDYVTINFGGSRYLDYTTTDPTLVREASQMNRLNVCFLPNTQLDDIRQNSISQHDEKAPYPRHPRIAAKVNSDYIV